MRNFFVLGLSILFFQFSQASHLRGGEMTFQCLQQGTNMGKLVFTIKLYRACGAGNAALGTTASISNPLYATYGGPSTITCTRIAQNDISPSCNGSSYIQCGVTGTEGNLAYEENIYVSSPVQINGIPANTGSAFTYSTCCRPSLINTSGSGFFIKTVMYPFTDDCSGQPKSLGTANGGPTCYDSSPIHVEKLPYLSSRAKDNYFSVKANDEDCDSLAYYNAIPLISSSASMTYNTGYSATYPLGNASTNVYLTIDEKTGVAHHKTYSTAGLHSLANKVVAYRNGQKVSETYQDYALILSSVGTDSFSINNSNPIIEFKNASSSTYSGTYSDTFNIGDSVNINIRATDSDLLDSTNHQSVSLRLIADPALDNIFNPFGSSFNTSATVDSNLGTWTGSAFRDTSSVVMTMKWLIDCEHLYKCMNSVYQDGIYQTYTFSAHAEDNNCLIPLNNIKKFSITVRDTSKQEGKIKSIVFTDSVPEIKWEKYKGSNFSAYYIYKADSAGAPFVLLDSNTSLIDTSYSDVYNFSSLGYEVYRIVTYKNPGCKSGNNSAHSIVLDIDTANMYRELTWNSMNYADDPFTSGFYEIECDTGGGWFVLDTVNHSGQCENIWFDNVIPCLPFVKFRVRGYDLYDNITYLSNADSMLAYDTLIMIDTSICFGDSAYLGGAYRKVAGLYFQQGINTLGCGITEQYNLSILPSYYIPNQPVQICKGERILLGGSYQSEAGTYFDVYQTKDGCDSIRSTVLSIRSVDTSVSRIGNGTLQANLAGAQYQWIKCINGNPVLNQTSRSFSPVNNNQSFAVVITDNGCVDTSSCYSMNHVGIEDNHANDEIAVYPNPASDEIHFDFNDVIIGKLSIYSLKGEEVDVFILNSDQMNVDLSEYANGLYYFQVIANDGKIVNGKILVKK